MSNPLNKEELQEVVKTLEGWRVENDKLKKDFKFKNFKEAAAFIMRIAFEAESLQHHPELFNVYSKVNISLCTHEAGDKITNKDVELAKAIDSILN